jgi:ATP phosphoribosyltransferase regulatory subunit
MDEAGLPRAMGRSPREIALRVQEKAELAAASLNAEHRAALDTFLALEVSIADAPEALRRTASSHGLEIAGALEVFATRIDALREAEFDVANSVFRAGFGRRLDYYTGLVFEIQCAGLSKPVAGGGRYDRLMSLLGAAETVPAVGFSIWLDRLAAAGGSA